MSLFHGPEEHEANPPETWRVERCGRRWNLCTSGGAVLSSYDTKRAAEQATTTGVLAALYADEARWYAGESVRGWVPYRELKSRRT